MNYIFLDIDGVLNNIPQLLAERETGNRIDDKTVIRLKELVRNFNAKIILSSSWKRGFGEGMQPIFTDGHCAELVNILDKYGLVLTDKTSDVNEGGHWSRPTEIYNYVQEHLTPEDNYVILDDDDIVGEAHPDLVNELAPHFVHTNINYGLDDRVYLRVCRIFDKY